MQRPLMVTQHVSIVSFNLQRRRAKRACLQQHAQSSRAISYEVLTLTASAPQLTDHRIFGLEWGCARPRMQMRLRMRQCFSRIASQECWLLAAASAGRPSSDRSHYSAVGCGFDFSAHERQSIEGTSARQPHTVSCCIGILRWRIALASPLARAETEARHA